jgi:hypothetical protein
VATATSINKVIVTAPATGSTLTIADGKTLTANNSVTLAGTDATTMTFPSTSASIARTDAAQTFTGVQTFLSPSITTPTGIVKGDIGLGNVDNTSDLSKPVSTLQQAALDLKAPLASPTLTGEPLAPTATAGTNTTQIATTAFVTGAITTANATNANLTGEVTSVGNTTTIANGAVTAVKINDGAVTTTKIAASNVTYDRIQNVSATNKVLGRSSAGAGVIEEIATTGSGDVVRATSPTLIAPNLGTPASGVATNLSGTAPLLTAGNVTTNANLTGAVVSSGNATLLGTFTSANLSGALSDETGTGAAVLATNPTLGGITMADATNIALNTTTGTKIGTATTQKLGFYNAAPVVQQTGDIVTALSNLGLVTNGTVIATQNANLTGPITSVGNTTSVASQTGTGSKFVMDNSPTLVNPTIGTVGSAVAAIIRNSQSAGTALIAKTNTTEVTYNVTNVTAGATAIVSFDAALTPGIYVAYTITNSSSVTVGYGNATNTDKNLSSGAVNIKIVVIQ